jgi:transcriptional regulator with XRE-family HTH domain
MDSKMDSKTRNGTKTFGHVLANARKQAQLTQAEVIARLRGLGISWDESYLSAAEHDRRYRPSNDLIKQLAVIVGISADILYFHAGRLPPDISHQAENRRIELAFQTFRRTLKQKSNRKPTRPS